MFFWSCDRKLSFYSVRYLIFLVSVQIGIFYSQGQKKPTTTADDCSNNLNTEKPLKNLTLNFQTKFVGKTGKTYYENDDKNLSVCRLDYLFFLHINTINTFK